MKIIMHDLSSAEFAALDLGQDSIVIADNGTIRHCIGCFGCWVKTPGVCVLKDGYENMGALLSQCNEVVIISRCVYGSYSPFVRNIWDRSLPYLLPYFTSINKETHHKNRYENHFTLSVYFYGEDITPRERETATALVCANGINFYAAQTHTAFYETAQALKGAIV